MPEPKDAATALWTLGQIEPAQRLPLLAFHIDLSPTLQEILKDVLARRTWDQSDLDRLGSNVPQKETAPSSEDRITTLKWWSHPDEFGERYLAALQAYVEVFFAEEERRISPTCSRRWSEVRNWGRSLTFPT